MSLMSAKKHGWKITNLTLVGWHGFDMDDIEISPDGVTMITAENGVGKTSTLDAITTILNGPDIGSSSKIGFNALAQPGQSNRSLVSYMLGEHNDKIRRDVSHTWLALSFRHSQKKLALSLIIYMYADAESYAVDSRKPRERRCMIVDGHEVSVNDFVTQEGDLRRPMDYREWTKAFDRMGDVHTYDKPSEYRDNIRKNLGPLGSAELSEHFYNNLKTMMQKRDIRDISGFIRNDLLQRPDINLNAMQSTIATIDEFQAEITECELMITDLRSVVKSGESVIDLVKKIEQLKEQVKLSELFYYSSSRDNLIAQINTRSEQIAQLQKDLEEAESRGELLQAKVEEAYIAKNNDTHEQQIRELNSQKEIIATKLQYIHKECSNIINISMEIYKTIKSSFDIDMPIESKSNIKALLAWIEDHEDDLMDIQRKDELLYRKEKDLFAKQEKLAQLIVDKENFEQNNRRPETNALKLMNELKRNNIEGVYLFETITSIVDEWRIALESVLGYNRSSIIVDSDDYSEAVRVLRNSGIIGTRIVSPKTAQEQYNITSESLFNKLECNNSIAKAYLESLIGSIQCVDGLDNLKRNRNAIMATPLNGVISRMSNWTVSNIKAIDVSGFLLSSVNPEERTKELAKLSNYIAQLTEQVTALQTDINKTKADIENVNKINDFFDEYSNNKLSIFDESESLLDEYNALNSQIEAISKNDTHAELVEAYNLARKEVQANDKLRKTISEEKGALSTKIELDAERVNNMNNRFMECCKQYNVDSTLSVTKPDFIDDNNSKDLDAFIQKIKKDIYNLDRRASDIRNIYTGNFALARNKYQMHRDVLGWTFFMDDNIDNLSIIKKTEEMQKFIEQIEGTYLLDKKETLRQWKDELIIKLKEDYVSKAYASMYDNQELIKRLNKAIGHLRYHNSKYIFTSKIKSDYKKIQDFIIEARDSGGIFALEDFGNIDVLDVLLTKIKEGEDTILDPRNWFEYDIRIEPEDGTATTVSKRLTTGSGGEIAAPYYVCMCAALSIVSYPNNSSNGGLCIALFDESFEKLDTSVINEIFKMFEVSGIQVILCDPGKNLQLNALCGKWIQLHKDGEKLFISDITIGDKVKEVFIDSNPTTVGKNSWMERERQKNQGQLL